MTDVNEAPEFTGTPMTTVNLEEHDANDAYVVMDLATYTARDEEGGVTWSLTGTDSDDFAIDSNGVVTFAATPNFEGPADSGGDNIYTFTVVATDVQSGSNRLTDSVAVTVTVADLEEPGVITVTTRPRRGRYDHLHLDRPGRRHRGQRVQLECTRTRTGGSLADSLPLRQHPATVEYTADEDHVGLEVRAVVASYQDRRGSGKSAESEPTTAVTADPVANAPPGSLAFPPVCPGRPRRPECW